MGAEQAANPLSQFIPFIFIFLIFYFIVIRPEKKKKDEHKKMIENLKKNDRVVTAGGIHGTVVQTKDKTVVLRVDDSTKVEFDKESVSTITKTKSASKE